MKKCEQCGQTFPDHANYCMTCGKSLATVHEQPGRIDAENHRGWKVFWLTLGGSLLLSWLLVAVLHLPVFIIGAFLPLIWYSRK